MTQVGLTAALARTRRAVARTTKDRSDGQLLIAFLATNDTDAFAELVVRYGPMVFAVCRRGTGHHQNAEDAFQATFVVLARKAATIAPREAVGSWLHGVAVRTAREARAMAAKRLAREIPVAHPPEAARPDPEPDDRVALIHEELAEMPDKFRTLLVLCDLRGEPQTGVAARLGLPVGTVYSRLARARKLLATRLRSRGLALSAAGLAVAFGQSASARVPADLMARALTHALSPALAPAPVAALSNGVLLIMITHKLKTALTLAALVLGVLACAALAGDGEPSPRPHDPSVPVALGCRPAEPSQQPKANPKPAMKGPNKLLFVRQAELTLVDPEGTNENALPTGSDKFQPDDAKFSPDGSMLAVIGIDHDIQTKKTAHPLYVRKTDDKGAVTELGVECRVCVWSADGTRLACTHIEDAPDSPLDATHFIIDAKSKEKTAVKLPNNHVITDWSRDGRYFLTYSVEKTGEREAARLHLMNRDGTEHKALTDKAQIAVDGRLSPDGKRVLCVAGPVPPKDKPGRFKGVLTVLDVATGKATAVGDVPLNANVEYYCWGPDGKRIAYVWRELHEGKPEEVNDKETVTTVVVCDPDGKNQKTVATATAKSQWLNTITGLDWR